MARPAHYPVDAAPDDSDERRLIASILQRDRKAAARFVAAHVDAVHGYLRHRLTPRLDLVDDLVQDVFLAGLTGLAAFQGQSSLRTWLIGIARHKVEDVYRQRLRAAMALDDLDADDPDLRASDPTPDEQIDTSQTRERVLHVLARLPERYGLVLLWRYWEQRTTRDIATAIDATEKSVERMLARARARFKDEWLKDTRDDR